MGPRTQVPAFRHEGAGPELANGGRMNRPDARLLVVDDSPSMRMCLCYILRQLGFVNIDEASDGRAALAMFRRTPYDLVITDWYMPQLSGLDLLRAIRSGADGRTTPVLVLTGTVTSGSLHEAVAAGATGFVPKPFFNPSLTEQVVNLVALMPSVGHFEADEGMQMRVEAIA